MAGDLRGIYIWWLFHGHNFSEDESNLLDRSSWNDPVSFDRNLDAFTTASAEFARGADGRVQI